MLPEIKDILDSVSDERVLRNRRPEATPLDEMIDAYVMMTQTRPNMLPYSHEWTGRHLKAAIDMLSDEDQHILITTIFERTGKMPLDAWRFRKDNHGAHETPQVRDERRFRIWLLQYITIFGSFFAAIIMGGVFFSIMRYGIPQNSSLIGEIFNTSSEIVKLLLSTSISN